MTRTSGVSGGRNKSFWFTEIAGTRTVYVGFRKCDEVATNYYQFSDSDSPVVEPDRRFDPSWADYNAGRDAVNEWILQRKECL